MKYQGCRSGWGGPSIEGSIFLPSIFLCREEETLWRRKYSFDLLSRWGTLVLMGHPSCSFSLEEDALLGEEDPIGEEAGILMGFSFLQMASSLASSFGPYFLRNREKDPPALLFLLFRECRPNEQDTFGRGRSLGGCSEGRCSGGYKFLANLRCLRIAISPWLLVPFLPNPDIVRYRLDLVKPTRSQGLKAHVIYLKFAEVRGH